MSAPDESVPQIVRGARILAKQAGTIVWAGEWQETVARWIVLAVVGALLLSACAQHSWVPWILLGLALLAAHAAGRPDEDDDEEEGEEEPGEEWSPDEILAAVWKAVGDDRGVLLTTLRTVLEVETTAVVRELLAEAGIPVRKGVRTEAGNGPGVHRDDLPPLPPVGDPAPVGVVAPGQGANTNANNTTGPEVHVRPDGTRVMYVTDPDNPRRVHIVTL